MRAASTCALLLLLLVSAALVVDAAPRRLYDDDDEAPAAAAASAGAAAAQSGDAATNAGVRGAAASAPRGGARKGSLSADDDDDEFPSAAAAAAAAAAAGADASGSGSGASDAGATGERAPFSWSNYVPELATLALIGAYILNYIVGSGANNRIALYWHEAMHDLFLSQFSALSSFAEGSGAGSTFLRDSANCFKFFASGRRNTSGVLVTIDLKTRQCLFGSALAFLGAAGAARDSVTLEFAADALEPLVYCVARKREEARLRKSRTDLDNYAPKSVQCAPLVAAAAKLGVAPFAHVQMADGGGHELVDSALNAAVYACIVKHADLFAAMHVSDQYAPAETEHGDPTSPAALAALAPRKVLAFKFYLPADLHARGLKAAALPALMELTKMALHLVDAVASVRLSLPVANRAREARAAVAKRREKTPAQRQAEIAAKLKEEKRKKEEAALELMSPEQRRRHEEKQEAKERAKRAHAKVKVMR